MKPAAVLLALLMSGCYRAALPRIHLSPGPSIVYSENVDTMEVSEGWVQARYHSWRQNMSERMAQGRLVMLCVADMGNGRWIVRRSELWEE